MLRAAVKKYGRDSFQCELIDVVYSQEDADYFESMWISALGTYKPERGYNVAMGGRVPRHGPITRANMSLSRTGEGNPFYGKKHTEDAKRRMSAARRGRYLLGDHPKAKKVRCVETNVEYSCAKEAQIRTGANAHHIGQVANHAGRNTAGGFHWEWVK